MKGWLKMNNGLEKDEAAGAKLSAAGRLRRMLADERGAVGVKEIAITVAAIVIIGAVVSLVTGSLLGDWIDEIWTLFMNQIEKMTS
ncbi:hypothetical protein C2I18_18920 [Paenibacillus sp. PK3_47]|uniref:hypothetical protein n=1 Tax=Paenibacillus sp. PK3_47 TaxID=2072642 RepID=UPI00201E0CC7|nr:hypothetical protein [Paenibacillus sp. PK3_47]UQZ35410.1 hypothetical protein C2I18_18920 [Paenibacillus sp. PK3_47]